MVETIGVAPFAKALLLHATDFTEEVLSQQPNLPLPITPCINGTMVIHLHCEDIDTFKEATQRSLAIPGLDGYIRMEDKVRTDFPEGYGYHGVMGEIKGIIGSFEVKEDHYQPIRMVFPPS